MFESRLDKVWSNQPVRFWYREELELYNYQDLGIEGPICPTSGISPMMMTMMRVIVRSRSHGSVRVVRTTSKVNGKC